MVTSCVDDWHVSVCISLLSPLFSRSLPKKTWRCRRSSRWFWTSLRKLRWDETENSAALRQRLMCSVLMFVSFGTPRGLCLVFMLTLHFCLMLLLYSCFCGLSFKLVFFVVKHFVNCIAVKGAILNKLLLLIIKRCSFCATEPVWQDGEQTGENQEVSHTLCSTSERNDGPWTEM